MNKPMICIRENVDKELLSECVSFLEKNNLNILEKSKIFSLLGNDVRLKIINIFLNYERLCVCDLSDILGMSQSPISQHLRKLKDGGLLDAKREGMTVFYNISSSYKKLLKNMLEG